MEKKKLLLVAISVGMVLLILISIPLVLVSQNSASSRNTVSSVRIDTDNFVVTDPQEVTQIEEITPDPEPQEQITTPEPVQQRPAEAPRVTIIVPTPRSVAVPDARTVQPAAPRTQRPAAPAATAAPAAAPAAQTPAAAPAAQTPAAATPVAAAPTSTQQTAAQRPASSVRAQTNYWVQTGAFSTKVRAEGVKESLESQGISSIIDNPEINGRTLYRVRVGPYVNETEANWWLALVQSIDGFADSQVRQSQVVVQ